MHRVKKELLQKDFCEGELKMIYLNLFILALKTTWVRKLFRTECKWNNILFSTMNQEKLFNFGNGYISYIKENLVNNFGKMCFMLGTPLLIKKKTLHGNIFCLLHCG